MSDFTPDGDPWVLAFWMFQVVFAATAATIVSGAMAERTRFQGYIIYSIRILNLNLAHTLNLALGDQVTRLRTGLRLRER